MNSALQYRNCNPPFFSDRSYIAQPVALSIVFPFDENRGSASAGLGGAAVGNARIVPDRAARSHLERAHPSARVGKWFELLRGSGIDRIAGPAPSGWVRSVGPDGYGPDL